MICSKREYKTAIHWSVLLTNHLISWCVIKISPWNEKTWWVSSAWLFLTPWFNFYSPTIIRLVLTTEYVQWVEHHLDHQPDLTCKTNSNCECHRWKVTKFFKAEENNASSSSSDQSLPKCHHKWCPSGLNNAFILFI